MEAGPPDDARAAALGFDPERELLQMRVALPLPDEIVAATRPLATRAFVPGRDEEGWVDTNNRAFAGHPEQGDWTVEALRDRMDATWVELDGFLLADDPDGPGLIGSCWTKIHRDRSPVLGEIYVISVDPRHHGQGWGRSLTVAGLQWMAGRGVTTGMLYTDASNEAAVALYRSLGFTVDHIDRSYRRDPD
jgi:mycothiol synthase